VAPVLPTVDKSPAMFSSQNKAVDVEKLIGINFSEEILNVEQSSVSNTTYIIQFDSYRQLSLTIGISARLFVWMKFI